MRALRTAVALIASTTVLFACTEQATAPGEGAELQTATRPFIVVPDTGNVRVGDTLRFIAQFINADGSVTKTWARWTSSDTSIARINYNGGLARGRRLGTVTIRAKHYKRIAYATLNVVDTTVSPPSAAPVATVVVSPASASVAPGGSVQLSATTQDSAGNVLTGRAISWSTSDPAIATVDSAGTVRAVAAGAATITATSEGKSGSAAITVTSAAPAPVASVTVTPSTASLTVGQGVRLVATTSDSAGNALSGRAVTWTTSNPAIATVDTSGYVTSVAAGSATIVATSEGKSGSAAITVTNPAPAPVASVTVSPSTASLTVGQGVKLVATTKDSAGATLTGRAITWSSSAPSIASVDSTGYVTAVAAGSATITATSEGKSGTAAITVAAPAPAPVASVTVTPSSAALSAGQGVQLQATTKDSAGNVLTGRTITWTTSNPAVASVTSSGYVTAMGAGTASIVATSEGKTGSASISVSAITSTGGLNGDPAQLQTASRQTAQWQSYAGRTLAAGGSYNDPVTGVRVWKLTSSSVPLANAGMMHMYSSGPVQISRRQASGIHTALFYVNNNGDFWLADIAPGSGISNYRRIPISDAYLTATFSMRADTPEIMYYFSGNTLVRYNTRTNAPEASGLFPKTFSALAGTTGHWLQGDKNDAWFVFMDAAATTIYAWNSQTDQLQSWAPGSLDEPHFDREGRFVASLDNANVSQVRMWDLSTGTKSTNLARVVHPGFLRGEFVAADPYYDTEYYISGASAPVTTLQPQQHSDGVMHRGDQWIQSDALTGGNLLKQWYLYSAYQDGQTSLGSWTLSSGQIYSTTVGFDWNESSVGVQAVDQVSGSTTIATLTKASSLSAMTDGSFFWDNAAGRLYVWAQGGGSPSGRVNAFANGNIHDAIAFVRVDGSEMRLVAHTYSRGTTYETQPHATISPDGLMAMWTSDMGVAGGRGDVFVAEMPAR